MTVSTGGTLMMFSTLKPSSALMRRFHGPGEQRLVGELPVDVAVLEAGTLALLRPLAVGDAAVGDAEPAVVQDGVAPVDVDVAALRRFPAR